MTIRFLLLLIARRLRSQTGTYKNVLKDSRTPGMAKMLLGLAVFYMMLPFDFIPDFIPIVGQMDDAIIIPTLVGLAFILIPKYVWKDAREIKANAIPQIKSY